MRSTVFAVSMLILLSSCTLPGSQPQPQKLPEYPTTQSGSPAATYCMQNGGQVSYEKNPNIPTMDMVYCTPKGGEKVDAWKYMDAQTTQTGGAL